MGVCGTTISEKFLVFHRITVPRMSKCCIFSTFRALIRVPKVYHYLDKERNLAPQLELPITFIMRPHMCHDSQNCTIRVHYCDARTLAKMPQIGPMCRVLGMGHLDIHQHAAFAVTFATINVRGSWEVLTRKLVGVGPQKFTGI